MNSKVLRGPEPPDYKIDKCVGQYYFEKAKEHGDKICQIDATRDEKESYRSVLERSVRVAIEMKKLGFGPKDTIMLCTINTIDTMIPVMASFFLGGAASSLDPLMSSREKKYLMSIVSPKLVFVDQASEEEIEACVKESNPEAEIVVFGDSAKHLEFKDFLRYCEEEESFTPADVDLDETAFILFSSGSTGLPKAILYSHRNYLLPVFIIRDRAKAVFQTMLHLTTFYWLAATLSMVITFRFGGTRVFLSKFNTKALLESIEKYKVTATTFVSPFTYDVTSFPKIEEYDLSSLRSLGITGSPISAAQYEKTSKIFKNTIVQIVYGMSESGLLTVFALPADYELMKARPTSCGKAATGVSLKVVDLNTGELLGPNRTGEICCKSLTMMKGYKNIDNSEVFDEDGYLRTGDLGYYDDDHCLFVVDRVKEMFKYKIWHVVPSVLEAVFMEHPRISEAVVFGIPSEEFGHFPAAAVVLAHGSNLGEEEILEWFNAKVADWEKLRGGVTIVDELPKTPSGKVRVKMLKEHIIGSHNKNS